MFALDEQTQMVAGVVRQWCQANLTPRLPALEAGEEMPFELMRKMAKAFGFDAMLGGAIKKRLERLRAGEAADAASGRGATSMFAEATKNPMLMHVVVKELSRVSPGFAMASACRSGSWGGAIVAKGTPEQIERWGLPLATLQPIGSWCLTEPGAGSDAFGSMRTAAAVPDGAGEGGAGYVLTGSKTFITNGPGRTCSSSTPRSIAARRPGCGAGGPGR